LETDKKELISELDAVCEKYKDVQENVLNEELMKWKKDQRQFEISESDKEQLEISKPDKLKIIKKWCEDLAEIICNMRQLVKQLENLMPSNDVKLLLLKILTLLHNLVNGTFIIEKQPQQVETGHQNLRLGQIS
jgi:hypothetical protein